MSKNPQPSHGTIKQEVKDTLSRIQDRVSRMSGVDWELNSQEAFLSLVATLKKGL